MIYIPAMYFILRKRSCKNWYLNYTNKKSVNSYNKVFNYKRNRYKQKKAFLLECLFQFSWLVKWNKNSFYLKNLHHNHCWNKTQKLTKSAKFNSFSKTYENKKNNPKLAKCVVQLNKYTNTILIHTKAQKTAVQTMVVY